MLRVLDLKVYAVGPAQNDRGFPWISAFHGFHWIPNLLRCWPTSSKSPAFRSCSSDTASLQDAPTNHPARPCKTCLCDQDNEHTLLQPFWRQLQAWQEPTNLVASQHLLPLPVLICSDIIVSCNFASMSMPAAPKGNRRTVEIFESGNTVGHTKHAQCKNWNKFRTGSSKMLQANLVSATPYREGQPALAWIKVRHTLTESLSMNLNESNDLYDIAPFQCFWTWATHRHVIIAADYHVELWEKLIIQIVAERYAWLRQRRLEHVFASVTPSCAQRLRKWNDIQHMI